ncbi:MAG: fibronectin type III domain-containing protein, partial [Intrasporangiaceae bacterium]|nr:fibronectin type III domain-containing protein [Intrasporangiaceae bacterium]
MSKTLAFRHDNGNEASSSSALITSGARPPQRHRRGGLMRRGLAGLAAAAMVATGMVVTALPGSAVVTDQNPEFRLNKADLDFILRQIQISESHAAGNPLLCENPNDTSWTCVPDPKLPYGVRTVDGSYNNLIEGQERYGAAAEQFPRLAPPLFRDADPAPFIPGNPTTSYAEKNNLVVDAEPRMISNLIVDQTVANPAAVEMMTTVEGSYAFDHDTDGYDYLTESAQPGFDPNAPLGGTPDRIFIPNVSPDVGLSAPFTGWFTLFGQFFDHGLDLVSKGGSGSVMVPLQPDDELYVDSSPTNFMMLSRATNLPGPDGIPGNADDVQEHVNRTTPFIDQNQTYTSHASHQVFLREYEMDAGRPVNTGKLMDGDDADGDGVREGLANWDDIKEQSLTMLGIELDDMDVHDVPLLLTDPYGHFIPGPNGFPQLVISDTELLEGDPTAPVDATQAMGAGVAFLDDIAHAAVPTTDGAHDSVLLGKHFITGDGRGNENIGLSAVHHIFHSEHNRLVHHIEDLLTEIGTTDQEFVDRWHDVDLGWDYGERLFQAARFVTEMEYQHLVFEEFVRTISPNIDAGPLNESLYHADIDPAISAEFAHVVYRFGHSMLTEDVARIDPTTGEAMDMTLFDAFLNPDAFTNNGAWTPDQGAAAVLMGMSGQTGNGIDEFVDSTLRNQLLGLPLDLATFNIARARDTGSPTLQAMREVFYSQTLDAGLKPYASWEEFRLGLKNRASVVNFIAAYGNHADVQNATTVVDKRAAAAALMQDTAFMTAPAAESGVNDVDFWVGGLAERGMDFGGMLGSTFNAVFETEMEDLQNGDRFYYLTRTQGMNLIQQLEGNSFSELALRNTEATGLNHNIFANPTRTFDVGDPATWDDGDPLTPDLAVINGWHRFDGEDHVNIQGTPANDRIWSGIGDDSVWGFDGDDDIEGGQGNDVLVGGHGDDVITDLFGDDVIHGGDGNDAINAGAGLDLLFGGAGVDLILHNQDPTQSFAGAGDDFLRGGSAGDIMTGNEGDDWMEGGNGADLVQGDNALTFQNDPNGGHDVLIGGSGNDDHDAEGGDDIMSNNGVDRHGGMLGFDWVTHKHDPLVANADLGITVFTPPNVQLMRSRFLNVEGLSGWDRNDVLRGNSFPGDQAQVTRKGHELTQEHLDRIIGLRDLLGGGPVPRYATPFMTDNPANNIILGGKGSDILEGRGGDDFLDGDHALDVYIAGPGGQRFESIVDFQTSVFSRSLSLADLTITRAVIDQETDDAVIDSAVYGDVRANHTVTENGDGTWTVSHPDTGTDTLRNIERLVFTDESVDLVPGLNSSATGTIDLSTMEPVEDVELSLTPAFDDPDGLPADPADIAYAWQWADNQGTWTTSVNGTGTSFTPGDTEAGRPLRVVATFTDGSGVAETITSPATAPVVNVNDAPTGFVISPTGPMVGDLMTASEPEDVDGTRDDQGNLIVSFVYQWQSSGDGGSTWQNINGTRSSTFTPTADHAGLLIRARVRYTDGHGTAEEVLSPASTAVGMVATVPGAPTIGTATAGDSEATVTWTAPADTGNLEITGYTIEVQDSAGLPVGLPRTAGPGTTSLVVDGLANGTEYRFRVQAENQAGLGPFSELTNAVTPFSTPTVVSSTPADGATGVPVGTNVNVFFSENVTGYDGNVTITKVSDGSV